MRVELGKFGRDGCYLKERGDINYRYFRPWEMFGQKGTVVYRPLEDDGEFTWRVWTGAGNVRVFVDGDDGEFTYRDWTDAVEVVDRERMMGAGLMMLLEQVRSAIKEQVQAQARGFRDGLKAGVAKVSYKSDWRFLGNFKGRSGYDRKFAGRVDLPERSRWVFTQAQFSRVMGLATGSEGRNRVWPRVRFVEGWEDHVLAIVRMDVSSTSFPNSRLVWRKSTAGKCRQLTMTYVNGYVFVGDAVLIDKWDTMADVQFCLGRGVFESRDEGLAVTTGKWRYLEYVFGPGTCETAAERGWNLFDPWGSLRQVTDFIQRVVVRVEGSGPVFVPGQRNMDFYWQPVVDGCDAEGLNEAMVTEALLRGPVILPGDSQSSPLRIMAA